MALTISPRGRPARLLTLLSTGACAVLSPPKSWSSTMSKSSAAMYSSPTTRGALGARTVSSCCGCCAGAAAAARGAPGPCCARCACHTSSAASCAGAAARGSSGRAGAGAAAAAAAAEQASGSFPREGRLSRVRSPIRVMPRASNSMDAGRDSASWLRRAAAVGSGAEARSSAHAGCGSAAGVRVRGQREIVASADAVQSRPGAFVSTHALGERRMPSSPSDLESARCRSAPGRHMANAELTAVCASAAGRTAKQRSDVQTMQRRLGRAR